MRFTSLDQMVKDICEIGGADYKHSRYGTVLKICVNTLRDLSLHGAIPNYNTVELEVERNLTAFMPKDVLRPIKIGKCVDGRISELRYASDIVVPKSASSCECEVEHKVYETVEVGAEGTRIDSCDYEIDLSGENYDRLEVLINGKWTDVTSEVVGDKWERLGSEDDITDYRLIENCQEYEGFTIKTAKAGNLKFNPISATGYEVFVNGQSKGIDIDEVQVQKGDIVTWEGITTEILFSHSSNYNNYDFISEILSWGEMDFVDQSNLGSFHMNLKEGVIIKDDLKLKHLSTLEFAFAGNFVNPNISLNHIDVSNITSFVHAFDYSNFNGDLSEWDVSNGVDFESMFDNSIFNQDISNWDVSNGMYFGAMFRSSKFDQDISNWDVSNGVDFTAMFDNSIFNQDISNWDVSNATSCSRFADSSPIYNTSKMPNFTNCTP